MTGVLITGVSVLVLLALAGWFGASRRKDRRPVMSSRWRERRYLGRPMG